jgi:hypothetical protein
MKINHKHNKKCIWNIVYKSIAKMCGITPHKFNLYLLISSHTWSPLQTRKQQLNRNTRTMFSTPSVPRRYKQGHYISNNIIPSGGVVEYFHRSPASLRSDKKRSLESGRVKRVRESHRTRTEKWLRWRGPAAIVHNRSVLSSERPPHINKPQLSDCNKDMFVSPRWVFYSKTVWPTDRRS